MEKQISEIRKHVITRYEFEVFNPLATDGERVENISVEVWDHEKTNEDNAYSVICVNDDPTPYKGKMFDYSGEAHRQARLLIKEMQEQAKKPVQKLLPAPVAPELPKTEKEFLQLVGNILTPKKGKKSTSKGLQNQNKQLTLV